MSEQDAERFVYSMLLYLLPGVLANALMIVGVISLARGHALRAAVTGTMATAAASLFAGIVLTPSFYVWLTSIIVLAVVAWIQVTRKTVALRRAGARWNWVAVATIGSVVLYLTACSLPSLRESYQVHKGYLLLANGYTHVAWYANMLFIAALVLIRKTQLGMAATLASGAVVLALTTWFAGYELLIGYFLWQGSFLVLAVAAWLGYLIESRSEAADASRAMP
jgi:hypothetical protein